MKKYLFFLPLALAFAGLTSSCSDDSAPAPGTSGETAVTFSAVIPGEFLSRSGEGTSVDRLQWVVFDSDGTPLRHGLKDNAFTNGEAEVSISLIDNRKYTVAFFADATGSPYTVELGASGVPTGSISADYSSASTSSELLDAFQAAVAVTGGEPSVAVTLKRPLAQVNVGTADYAEATPVTATSLTLTGEFYTSMSLLDGSVPESACVATLTFVAAALPEESLTAGGRNYTYLAYAYVIPSATGSLIKDLALGTGDGATRTFSDLGMPVKRNFRSNLVGNLFSSDTDFDVNLDPGFDKPWDGQTLTEVVPTTRTIGGEEIEVYAVAQPAQLAWCASNLTEGYILLDADISLNNMPFTAFGDCSRGDANGPRFKGIFDGNGKTISDLTPVVHNEDKWGSALIAVAEDATIRNVTVKDSRITDNGDFAAAIAGTAFGATTIENCHVVNTTVNAFDKAGGILARAYGSNVVVKDCTVSGTITGQAAGGIIGSGAQTTGYTTTIIGCTNNARVYARNCGGIAGFMGHPVTMENCTNNGMIGEPANAYAGGMVGYFTNQTDNSAATYTACVNNGIIVASCASGMLGILRMRDSCTLAFAGCSNTGTLYTNGTYTIDGHTQIMGTAERKNDALTTITSWTDGGTIKPLAEYPAQ